MRAIVTLLFLITFFFLPTPTYAHVLQEDGSIGALLHIHPNDDPIAGEKSEFYLNVKDKQNKFNSKLCECSVTIFKAGKQIFFQPLFQNETQVNPQTSVSFSYTFPEKNIYTVRIDGKPLEQDAFQPFTLTFDVRVDYEVSQSQNDSEDFSYIPYIIGGGFIGLGAVILLMHKSRKVRR